MAERKNILTKITLERLLLFCVFLFSALPFANIFFLHVASAKISSYELIYIVMEGILLSIILYKLRMKQPIPFFIFFFISVSYIFISVEIYSVSFTSCINQLRNFMPFIIAITFVASGVAINLRQYMKAIIVASIISAGSALTIHYLFPSVIKASFEASPDVSRISEAGRMYWANGILLYFLIIFLFFRQELSRNWYYLLIVSILISFVVVFNTFGRTIIIGLFIIIGGSIFAEERFGGVFKKATILFSAVMFFVLIAIGLSSVDDRVRNLAELRYFGNGGGIETVYENAVVTTRAFMYVQYLASLEEYFPVGQGLGRPVAVVAGIDGYTTDVSILSFVLPFGILGFVVLSVFIGALFRLLKKSKRVLSQKQFVMIKLLLFSSLVISLNIDVFSRNNFVILVSILLPALLTVTRNGVSRVAPTVPDRPSCGVHGGDGCDRTDG